MSPGASCLRMHTPMPGRPSQELSGLCLNPISAGELTPSGDHPPLYWNTCCSVTKSYPTLCDPMDCSTPGFPVLRHMPELAQTHVHQVSDAIQPSHPLSSPSPPAFSLNGEAVLTASPEGNNLSCFPVSPTPWKRSAPTLPFSVEFLFSYSPKEWKKKKNFVDSIQCW